MWDPAVAPVWIAARPPLAVMGYFSRNSSLGLRSGRLGRLGLLALTVVLAACAAEAPKRTKSKPIKPGDDFYDGEPARDVAPLEPIANADSGAFPTRPSADAGADAEPTVPPNACATPVGPGDLAIVELMIATQTLPGDAGEWVEIASTRNCSLHIDGLTISSPYEGGVDTVTVGPLDLPPYGTFVVADSADPSLNHALPGTVFSWDAVDVLDERGDTVTVTHGETVIDTVTYGAQTTLAPRRSLSFPLDCSWSFRPAWSRWSASTKQYAPGFRGTPNGPNDDVVCF